MKIEEAREKQYMFGDVVERGGYMTVSYTHLTLPTSDLV